jgi:hypothetical protein
MNDILYFYLGREVLSETLGKGIVIQTIKDNPFTLTFKVQYENGEVVTYVPNDVILKNNTITLP